MSIGLHPPKSLLPVAGIRLSSLHSGIKADSSRDDLVLIELSPDSQVAAVFTRNRFCAAPVTLAKQHLSAERPRYLLINSGNANAGTGPEGLQDAQLCCQQVAGTTGVTTQQVLPFSTGVIGARLPVTRMTHAIPALVESLSPDQWLAAAHGIMTTDTLPKGVSRQLQIDGKTVTITGMCKGSGMICPDMATMLAYVATDAELSQMDLQQCLQQVVATSFNSITVDGDTSTNDACLLIATGQSGAQVNPGHSDFMSALHEVFRQLAQSIIRDGEGATKFVEVRVEQAASDEDARIMAYTIAHSPLVKTALFASDANWGRILAAAGRAPVSQLDIDRVDLFLGDVCLIENGNPHADYTEEKGTEIMQQQDIVITARLKLGQGESTIWTTDLSYDYIKINAEYRS